MAPVYATGITLLAMVYDTIFVVKTIILYLLSKSNCECLIFVILASVSFLINLPIKSTKHMISGLHLGLFFYECTSHSLVYLLHSNVFNMVITETITPCQQTISRLQMVINNG